MDGALLQPDDGAGRTAVNGFTALPALAIMDDRQVMDHRNEVAAIHGALATGRAAHLAILEDLVTVLQVLARHPHLVADRLQGEEVFGTDLHAIATGGAFVHIHHR